MAVDPNKVANVAAEFESNAECIKHLVDAIHTAMKKARVEHLTDEEVVALLIALGFDYTMSRYILAHT